MNLISRSLKPLCLTAILAGSTLMFNTAHAQDAPIAKPNPVLQTPQGKAAYQLLKDSAAAYRALKSYSGDVMAERSEQEPLYARVMWQRPNLLRAAGNIGVDRFQTLLSGLEHTNVLISPYSTRYTRREIDEAHSLSLALTDFSRYGLNLAYFMGSDDPLQPFFPLITSLRRRAATPVESENLDLPPDALEVVEIKLQLPRADTPTPASMIYVLGKTDKLLRRSRSAQQQNGRDMVETQTYTKVRLNPQLKPSDFVFAPSAAAQRVESLHPPADERLQVGVAPFELKATDLKGQPVSLDQYKNKVVLVDFWATWCGPCVEEIPNVIAAYQKHHDQGFEVIGISLDQDKKALDKYLADNAIPWPQLFDGKGWDGTISKRFGVSAIPFTMLIGRDGKIAALNARGEALDAAIATALAQ